MSLQTRLCAAANTKLLEMSMPEPFSIDPLGVRKINDPIDR